MSQNLLSRVEDGFPDLSSEEAETVLEFVDYLRWRRQRGRDYSWYWADEWRRRYREARWQEEIDARHVQ